MPFDSHAWRYPTALALMYRGGHGTAKDTPRAAKILGRAGDAGRGESCRALAKLAEPPRVVATSETGQRGLARPAEIELSPGERADLREDRPDGPGRKVHITQPIP